jgi:hypothetical protein
VGKSGFPRGKPANLIQKYEVKAISDVKVELARLRP